MKRFLTSIILLGTLLYFEAGNTESEDNNAPRFPVKYRTSFIKDSLVFSTQEEDNSLYLVKDAVPVGISTLCTFRLELEKKSGVLSDFKMPPDLSDETYASIRSDVIAVLHKKYSDHSLKEKYSASAELVDL
jgi:hypothetical protein